MPKKGAFKKSALQELRELDRRAVLLSQTEALLEWDQETLMPEPALENRSEQLSLISGLYHREITAPRTEELLNEAEEEVRRQDASLEGDTAFLREMTRRYYRQKKIPSSLVSRRAAATGVAQGAWVKARRDNSFEAFRPHMERVLALVRETAEAVGYEDHPYDALVEDYEPDMTASELDSLFEKLGGELAGLAQEIGDREAPDTRFLARPYVQSKQEEFARAVLTDMGYDWNRGRLDASAHPFTTGLGGDDIRITSRYKEDWPSMGIFGSIHEGGHALYEQGIDPALQNTLLGEGASLGIHESQSRFWENMIGRSRPFWEHYYGRFQAMFFQNLRDVSLEEFFRGINCVDPGQIRIEADEVTYSLHIILRYELEKALITGDLPVKDLPGVWAERQKALLGTEPASDAEGVLQDVHWSAGLIGYFPTYALGNLYAAQFRQALYRELPEVEEQIRRGEFGEILGWLRSRIHRYGRQRRARQLCRDAAGRPLDAEPFLSYLREKYTPLYGLS